MGECLNYFVKQFPDIEKVLFEENGKLHSYLSIYVNREDTYPEELAKPVRDGDEIHLPSIVGGG